MAEMAEMALRKTQCGHLATTSAESLVYQTMLADFRTYINVSSCRSPSVPSAFLNASRFFAH